MLMEQIKIEKKSLFKRTWSDPVLSKLISTALGALLVIFWQILVNIFKDKSVLESLSDAFTYQVELSKVILILIILALGYYFYKFWANKKKSNKFQITFDTNQRIGEFTFRELYNILAIKSITIPKNTIKDGSLELKINLLSLFCFSLRDYNRGSTLERTTFIDFCNKTIGPELMSYGLIKINETQPSSDNEENIKSLITTETGYKFYAMIQRYRLMHDLDLNNNTDIEKI